MVSELRILWFRRDLRLRDNAMLAHCQPETPVLAIYIRETWHRHKREIGELRDTFLSQSLQALHAKLRKLGTSLHILDGDPAQLLPEVRRLVVDAGYQPLLCFQRDVQYPYERERDQAAIGVFAANAVMTTSNDFLLLEGGMDIWRPHYYEHQRRDPWLTPLQLSSPSLEGKLPGEILPEDLPEGRSSSLFIGGEDRAHQALGDFLAWRYHGYHWRLSRPWQAQRGGTSQLSAHLAAGTISSREVSRAVQAKLSELDEHASERDRFALRSYLDRLRWRDSARQKFWLHPELAEWTGIREFDEVHRLRELSQLEATAYERWQEGTTGYPLLDASMRQLSRDGWIPFRMRAMAATFLCINCQVPWQYGALHFMNCLADGEACIDHWQWQSQAGLTDVLAATFRIYNPQKNLREKDPKLRYVRHWLPELAQHTDEEILRGTARYAEPVVEWESSRRLGGDALSEMRGRAQRRLTSQGGPLYEEAQRLRQAVSKYKRNKQRKYREMSEGRQLGLFDGE